MKKLFIVIGLLIISAVVATAQTPQSFKYQAIARDIEGNIISNQQISLKISIIQGSKSGEVVYAEVHDVKTNQFGLISLEIGNGNGKTGAFYMIDWSLGNYFVQIEIDVFGGTNYQLMGASQLLSVPYALYAERSGTEFNPTDIVVTEINDLTDGKTGGNSVFLGENCGVNDDGTENRNVGLGIGALQNTTGGYYNTALGFKALYSCQGRWNTATGYSALYANTSGFENVANGYRAMYSNTTGYTNIGIGPEALASNTTGSFNIALGKHALFHSSQGMYNTTIGNYAQAYNTTGSKNVALGAFSNHLNQTGNNNTIIGYEAGKGTNIHSKSGSVFIGYQAGKNELGSNKLYIENSFSSAPLIYGEFDNDLLRVNGTLDIKGVYQFPTVDGTAGQVLQTDGNGTLLWTTDGGASEINDLTDGKTGGSSVFLGQGAGINDDGSNRRNVAVGHGALESTTAGYHNTANGYKALPVNTVGAWNSAFGYQALLSNTTGVNNTAMGAEALYTNTTGTRNSTTGAWSMYHNTNGSYNVANGQNALFHNTTGIGNTGCGYNANFYNQTGSFNTIIGFEAGNGTTLHNKSGNVFIGYQAGKNELGSNKLYIENSFSSAPLIYGEFDNDLLRINGTLDIKGVYQFPTVDGTAGQVLQTDGNGVIGWVFNPGASALQWPDTSNQLATDYDLTLKQDIADTTNWDATRFWVQQQAYLTSFTEEDPLFVAHLTSGITETDTSNWNEAYRNMTAGNTPSYAVGDYAQGGIVFWVDETGLHGLVCAKNEQNPAIWGKNGDAMAEGDGIYSGEMNTSLIIGRTGKYKTCAALACSKLKEGEGQILYGDWYLPSISELEILFNNIGIINQTALECGWWNHHNHPADFYWSSTEKDKKKAYGITEQGQIVIQSKNRTAQVWAIRAF
jgi:trimeric autotransporter adhesin